MSKEGLKRFVAPFAAVLAVGSAAPEARAQDARDIVRAIGVGVRLGERVNEYETCRSDSTDRGYELQMSARNIEDGHQLEVEQIRLNADEEIRRAHERYEGNELNYQIRVIRNNANRDLLRAREMFRRDMARNRQLASRNRTRPC